MVEHFVLFTLKEDVTDAQYAELEREIYGLSGSARHACPVRVAVRGRTTACRHGALATLH